MQTIVLVVHVFVALMIVGLVLLQRGKGAEAGAAFGAGASGTVFGSRGSANFLSRSTAVLAAMFFLSSLTLAYFSGQQPEAGSLMDQLQNPPAEQGGNLPQQSPAIPDLPPLGTPQPLEVPEPVPAPQEDENAPDSENQ